MAKPIEIEVVAGMCELEFRAGSSIGKDEDTNPGIGFVARSTFMPVPRNGVISFGSGVIGRADAKRLRDYLDAFFEANP